MAHLTYTLLAALALAVALALLGGRNIRERLRHAAYVFMCSVAGVVAGGWCMYLIHRWY